MDRKACMLQSMGSQSQTRLSDWKELSETFRKWSTQPLQVVQCAWSQEVLSRKLWEQAAAYFECIRNNCLFLKSSVFINVSWNLLCLYCVFLGVPSCILTGFLSAWQEVGYRGQPSTEGALPRGQGTSLQGAGVCQDAEKGAITVLTSCYLFFSFIFFFNQLIF